jgi:hypothetical protein
MLKHLQTIIYKQKYQFMVLLELVIIFAFAVMVPEAQGQNRCFVVLNPNGCDLETCKKECFQQ